MIAKEIKSKDTFDDECNHWYFVKWYFSRSLAFSSSVREVK